MGRRWRWVLAVAASAGIVTTMAGAHGGSAALIHACVNKKSKIVRIVAPSAKCKRTERAVDWPAQTAVGAQGIQGPPGPPGPPGQPGQDGEDGEQSLPPAPPPTPYDGSRYSVVIEGTSSPLAVTLAGCFERQFGQPPEDCYLAFPVLTAELFGWLNDTAAGSPTRVRDLTIRRFSETTGAPVWQLEVADAFIAQARFPDLDAASDATLRSVNVVVVPGSLAVVPPSGGDFFASPQRRRITQNRFTLGFDDVNSSSMLAISGVGIDVPRVLAGGAGAPAFTPGAPSFSVFRVAAVAEDRDGPTNTALDLDAWSASVAEGTDDRRDGLLTLQNTAGEAIATIALGDVALVTALDPLPIANRRSLTLRPAALDLDLTFLPG